MRRTLILALTLFIATAAQAASDTIRRGFNVAEGGTLHLDAGIGSITIVTGGTGVAFEIIRDADGRKGAEVLRDHRITFRQEGNDVYVESDWDDSWDRWFRRYEVKWNIRVPARYNVDVRTSGGSIDLGAIGGTAEARTSGGSIRTGRVSGRAELRTSGGSVAVDGATGPVNARSSGGSIRIGNTTGSVEARTSGGSITIARVDGDVFARTSGGGIRIEDATGKIDATTSGGSIHANLSRQPRGDSRLSTSGGGVTVTLASGIAVDLDARASGGGVRSDVPITVMGKQDDDSLHGEINGGGPKLVLRTSGGGIRVKPMV
ncbi:MAG TPA: DUF4097 family beta strand repeat-containing protein [Thermoanaerobaculia bacterium]|nr:DUF4097 family beta strand repeat-containing protein [Thermoanaerobaculia bacterium]